MTEWLRRLRGALGIALAWAFTWFGAGMLLLLVVGPDAADVPFPLGFGFLGFWAGLGFSAFLALLDGRRSFAELSLPRVGLWGALGGLVLAVVMSAIVGPGAFAVLAPVFAVAGGLCATGSLALARAGGDPTLAPAEPGETLPGGE